MTLDAYLRRHRITTKKFAALLGVSINTVAKWRQRARKVPRGPAVMKIKQLTKGRVTAEDWYKNKGEK